MKTYTQDNLEMLSALKFHQLVQIALGEKWLFRRGDLEDWMTSAPSGEEFCLSEDCSINLDDMQPDAKEMDVAILYNRFYAPKDGIALLGIGIEYWFEAACNGIPLASTWETGNSTDEFVPGDQPFFLPVKKGENTLVLRVRRGTFTWTFACGPAVPQFNPEPIVTLGPWLGNPESRGIMVRFFTAGKIAAGVEYRKTGEAAWKLRWDYDHAQIKRREFHAIPLENLELGAEYEYRIVMMNPMKPSVRIPEKGEVIRRFTMPARDKSRFSLFFTADLQFPVDQQVPMLDTMLKAANAQECDFFVLGGDINSDFVPMRLFRNSFEKLAEYGAAQKPIVYVRGNHEYRGKQADTYPYYLGDKDGNSYYMFRYGDTAFLVLDCFEDKPASTPWAEYVKYNRDGDYLKEEQAFLRKAINSDEWKCARRRIVLGHAASFSHFDSCQTMNFFLRDMTDEFFAGMSPASKLDLWLAGHTHRYTRSIPCTDDIVAFKQPKAPQNGGKNYTFPVLTGAGPDGSQPIQASAFRLDFNENSISYKAFDENGRLFEHIIFNDNGTVEEILALPHFNAPPIENPTSFIPDNWTRPDGSCPKNDYAPFWGI